jgi:hypothetical protein
MKQRRPERVERRRPVVEFNLVSQGGATRPSARRRGCLPFLTPGVLVLAPLLAHVLGLH